LARFSQNGTDRFRKRFGTMNDRQGRWSLLATLLLSAWLVSACNTIEGAGQDIQRAGEELEEAAE